MNRRDFLKTLGASGLALSAPGALHALAQDRQRRPNFIVIFTDDQGYQDLGCFGSEKIDTPCIDRMAREGMRMTDFYVAASVCTPSRAALLTGCYPKRNSMHGPGFKRHSVIFPQDECGLHPEEITLASLLKKQGYATACIGKWHLGHHKPFLPTSHGFDSYFGVPYSNDMGRIPFRDRKGLPLMRDEKVIEQPVDQSTLTKRYTSEALKFIEDHRREPFFLYLPHTMPHLPLAVSREFRGKSDAGFYGDVIEEVDWSTGQILDKLRRLDLAEDTIVVFLSDNGPWLSRKNKDHTNVGRADPLRGAKGSTWEGGMRVPCVVWGPGRIAAGKTSGEVCTSMDLLPTLAAWAGTKPPADRRIDGCDIRPILTGRPDATSPTDAFFYYGRNGRLEAVREGKWKLRKGELYDLQADISESNDLAATHPEKVRALQARMKNFDARMNKEMRPVGWLDQLPSKP